MISLAIFIIFALYETISVPIYLRLIYVMLKNTHFAGSPLFRIVSIIGILEMCHFLVVLIFYRLPLFAPTADFFGQFTEPKRVISWAAFAMFFLRYLYIFLHVLVAINRATAIWIPLKYDKIWKKHWPRMVCFSFVIAFLLSFDRLFSSSIYAPMVKGMNGGFTPVPKNYDFYTLDQNLLTAISCGIGILLCLCLNGATFAKIASFKQLVKGVAKMSPAQLKTEVNLFIMAIWMTISLISLGIFQSLLYFLPRGSDSAIFAMTFLLTFVEDLNSLSQPWVLILTNQMLRKAAFPLIFGGTDLTSNPNIKIIKITRVAPAMANSARF
ncbi:hypothetical protein niasHT_019237 [Heterodera trifolii]|uniref:Serpentine receptor class gamma n=1 Tax=Heterodera trifolii TaxID=157864 RepID=A0ABD2L0K1_9BILA